RSRSRRGRRCAAGPTSGAMPQLAAAEGTRLVGELEQELLGVLPGEARVGDREPAALDRRAGRALEALAATHEEALEQEATHEPAQLRPRVQVREHLAQHVRLRLR